MCRQGCPGLSFRAGSLQPRGLCAGAGTLPPARVSTQPARGASHSAVGRSCGWKELPLSGQGPSAVERVLHGSGLLTAPAYPCAFPRALSKMEFHEREGVCLLRFLILVGWVGSGTFARGLFNGKVKGGITVWLRSFPASVFSVSSSGGYRQHQHHLSSLSRVSVTCFVAPAHTERLQGRAGCTGAEMGSLSTGSEEMWGQRNSSWQAQLQAAEMGKKGRNC